jgi:PIN domain nuclease of toxin-antitoxin system
MMRLLLDTHVFIRAVTDKLNHAARKTIQSADMVYVSAASIWEIAIKARLGKITGDPGEMAEAIELSGFVELPVLARHAVGVSQLPGHHNDPFDRLLIAQALSEPLVLLTADVRLAQYGAMVQLIA